MTTYLLIAQHLSKEVSIWGHCCDEWSMHLIRLLYRSESFRGLFHVIVVLVWVVYKRKFTKRFLDKMS